jgi:hypothetical protein
MVEIQEEQSKDMLDKQAPLVYFERVVVVQKTKDGEEIRTIEWEWCKVVSTIQSK